MGVPTSEVGYIPAMPWREDHKVHKGHRREIKPWIDPVQDYSVTAWEERSVTKTERGDCGNKGKGKVHTRIGHEGPEGEQRYSCTLSLTLALDGVRGQRHAPAALPPGKRPGSHCVGRWVGPRAGLDECGISRPPPGFDSRTVQPLAQSLYRLSHHGQPTVRIKKCIREFYPLHNT